MAAVKTTRTTGELRRLAIQARVREETDGKCQDCGAVGVCMPVSDDGLAFRHLCRVCNGKRGAGIRAERKRARMKQIDLFGDWKPEDE